MSTTTQQPAPDFGEPWLFEAGDIFTSKGDLVGDVYSGDGFIDECDQRGERIVATMNACASMRDPAAEIQALRDAASCLALLVDHGHTDDCLFLNRANAPCDCGVDQAEAALAKLKALA